MSREVLIAGQERKKAFLVEIIKKRIWQKKPDSLSDNQWLMQRKIGFQYTFTDKTLEELGKQYGGLTREDVRQLNHRFWDNIHNNSPRELKAQYPRASIPDSKPRALKSREKTSRSRGGLSWEISEFIRQTGITDPRKIAGKFKIPIRRVNRARQVLRSWGIIIPLTVAHYRDFFKQVENENNDQRLQEILDNSSSGSLLHYRQRYGNEAIMSLAQIVRKAEFYIPYNYMGLFAKTIQNQDIPIRLFEQEGTSKRKYRERHFIVFSKHEKRIIESLRNDSSLERFRTNPVQLICGSPRARIPTLTELAKNRYSSLGPLVLKTTGFRPSRAPQRNFVHLLKGCRTPVYTDGESYYYDTRQTQPLKSFLERRRQEIQSQTSQVA